MGTNRMKEAKEIPKPQTPRSSSPRSRSPARDLRLRAATLGQMIGADGNNPLTAMRNGMKSGSLMDKAVELGPDNPRFWVLKEAAISHAEDVGGGCRQRRTLVAEGARADRHDRPEPPRPRGERWICISGSARSIATRSQEEARAEYEPSSPSPRIPMVKHVLLPQLDR